MREILYRGYCKDEDNGDSWEYGFLLYRKKYGECFIVDTNGDMTVVEPDSIGQWTGRTTEDGTKIFEGDIVRVTYCPYFAETDREDIEKTFTGTVEYDNLRACFIAVDEEGNRYRPFEYQMIEIVGNAYEGGIAK